MQTYDKTKDNHKSKKKTSSKMHMVKRTLKKGVQ